MRSQRLQSGIPVALAWAATLLLHAAPLLRGAGSDELDDLLVQLKSAGNEKSARTIEERIRFAVKPGQTDRLLTALSAPHPRTTPLVLDLLATRAAGPATVSTLRKFLRPEPAWYAAGVLGALSRLGDPAALTEMTERADDGRLKPEDRAEYVTAIAILAVRGDDELRPGAWKVLGRLRVKEGLGAFLDGLTDPLEENRKAALSGLQGTLGTLFPYLRFNFDAVNYKTDGGDAASRDKAAESIRKWLPSLGIPKDVLKTLKVDRPPPTTQTRTGESSP